MHGKMDSLALDLYNRGCALEEQGDYTAARDAIERALQADGSLEASAQAVLARLHWREGRPAEAVDAADRSLAAGNRNLLAYAIRALACASLGRADEAVEGFRRAIEIAPDARFHSSLLVGMNFTASTTPEMLYAEACRWNQLYAAPLARHIRRHRNPPDPERRLRIGYVSPDLVNHAIMKFLPPVFEHHDRAGFEVFVYAVGKQQDQLTECVRRTADRFIEFRGTAGDLAARVRTDRIDILVDLAGHTMDPEMLLAFARKPAPVQVSWMGTEATTGLTAMDYFLGDTHMPCPGTEHLFSETVYRLPRPRYCYRPLAQIPVAPPPCRERGYVTYGCFNSPRKITRQVVGLWAEILRAVPASQLLLKSRGLETAAVQQRFRDWFSSDGVAPERLRFAGPSPVAEYMAAYGEIDIALDPFPHNGDTTTLDTLYMGVPVVTMSGRLGVQRDGATILAAMGMTDMVTESPLRYREAAVFLAGIVSQIPGLRGNVRRALKASPLMDEAGTVRAVEAAFREMWRRWCRSPR
jgi:predicted O-linked N-acetylglucosamine transferase (SPINDLY family)